MMSTWCSKHVEAWNKLIVKQIFCTGSSPITEMNGQQIVKLLLSYLILVFVAIKRQAGCMRKTTSKHRLLSFFIRSKNIESRWTFQCNHKRVNVFWKRSKGSLAFLILAWQRPRRADCSYENIGDLRESNVDTTVKWARRVFTKFYIYNFNYALCNETRGTKIFYNLFQPIKMATESQIRFHGDVHSICSLVDWNWCWLPPSLLQHKKGHSRDQHETRKSEKKLIK